MSFSENFDADEILKFENTSGSWWDHEGAFKPLHDINPLRLNYIDEKASLVEKRVLDVGCGGGILSEAMALRGAHVTGIDMGKKALQAARSHGLEVGVVVDYHLTTVEKLAQEQPASFDVVTCLEMLEHVPDPASIVHACFRLLKPGGYVFFSTINRTAKSWLFAIIGAEYILKLLPKGTHQHNKFIMPHELCQWMREVGLHYYEVMGMTYNPLTRIYKLNKMDVQVNYLLYGQKPFLK